MAVFSIKPDVVKILNIYQKLCFEMLFKSVKESSKSVNKHWSYDAFSVYTAY